MAVQRIQQCTFYHLLNKTCTNFLKKSNYTMSSKTTLNKTNDYDENNFIFVDDDGKVLPPEEASNVEFFAMIKQMNGGTLPKEWTMADAEQQQQHNVSSNVSTGAAANSGENSIGGKNFSELFSRIGGGTESFAQLREGKIQDDDVKVADDDEDNDDAVAQQTSDEKEQQNDEDEEEEEEEQFYSDEFDGFSRAYSDQDDGEWILEEILKRKLKIPFTSNENENEDESPMKQNQRQDTLSDYDDEELIQQQKSGIKRAVKNKKQQNTNNNNNKTHQNEQKVAHYLCRWRWYSKPTWELRESIVELGYLDLIKEYDAAHDSYHKSQHLARKARDKKKDVSLRELFGPPLLKNTKLFAIDREQYRWTVFEKMFPDWYLYLQRQMETCGRVIVDVANIAAPAAAARFLDKWSSMPEVDPIRVFHGTASRNMHGICTMGLVVPHTRPGVTVQNGSAYSIGIYSDITPRTPTSFARDNNMLLCCVALDPLYHDENVKHVGTWRIFYQNNYVVPVWLIRTRSTGETPCQNAQHVRKLTTDFTGDHSFVKMHKDFTTIVAKEYSVTLNEFTPEGGEYDVKATVSGEGTIARTVVHSIYAESDDEENDDKKVLPGDKKKLEEQRSKANMRGSPHVVKNRTQHIGSKRVSKKLIKQLPRSLKEVYGY